MHAQELGVRKGGEHVARHQRNAHARNHASEHGVVGGNLDDTIGHFAVMGEPLLEPLAVGATGFEREHRLRPGVARRLDRRMSGGGDDHQLFVVDRHLLEGRIGDGLGDEGGVEIAAEDGGGKLPGVAGAQLESDVGVTAEIFVHGDGQPHRGGAFARA